MPAILLSPLALRLVQIGAVAAMAVYASRQRSEPKDVEHERVLDELPEGLAVNGHRAEAERGLHAAGPLPPGAAASAARDWRSRRRGWGGCGCAAPDRGGRPPITFTLDGREVTAAPGETIWEVAKREGTRIPHLCHADAPGYRADGNCRACMVEIEGERVLAASCIRKPAAGHGGATASERAVKARAMVMELLLADQPARAEAHDRSSQLWGMAALQGSRPAGSRRGRAGAGARRQPRGDARSTSTPASTATSASAPAARCR